MTPDQESISEPMAPVPARHGSAAAGVGEEPVSIAVDIPWDTYLGVGATARLADGSLRAVRHAYPATAAGDIRAAATATGQLLGDAATHERLAAVAIAIASAHHRPARLPHRPNDEPHAWWIAEERTLVWLPWADIDEPPYGLDLLNRGEADSVTILAPDAIWTIFESGIPRAGSRGGWLELPDRLRSGLAERGVGTDLQAGVQWERAIGSNHVVVRWRQASGELGQASIEVNRRSSDGR